MVKTKLNSQAKWAKPTIMPVEKLWKVRFIDIAWQINILDTVYMSFVNWSRKNLKFIRKPLGYYFSYVFDMVGRFTCSFRICLTVVLTLGK